MPIDRGARLGPYEFIEPAGAGGMGEVWRGRDTRLDRTVAIKVLPPEFAKNAQLRLRFEREAKAISSLNHPHICTLHDVGLSGMISSSGSPVSSEEDVHYLVMEYLEGESLAERLTKGPLPLEQVLKYGRQVAEALDAAHRQGVIHRDLKPGNVMITKAGAKLLDFGLAKSASEARAPIEGLTNVETAHRPLTQEGTILGTFQYMAPEQLEGLEADPRTDIFALGALLYEMATGRRAFQGTSKTSLIAAIVSAQPPPISQITPMTPPVFEHVVRKCLEKDPDDRWQSARDVASELQWISEVGSLADVPSFLTRRKGRKSRALWMAAGVVAGAIAVSAAWIAVAGRAEPAGRITHFSIAAPKETLFLLQGVQSFAVRSDGGIAYIGRSETGPGLFFRKPDDFAPTAIPGTERLRAVTFSPDGRWLAFFRDGKLKKVSVEGGLPIDLCDAPSLNGLWWGGDTIYFTATFSEGIWSVPEGGGVPTRVAATNPAANERALLWPQLLPSGRHLLFSAWTGGSFDDSKIMMHSLETGERRVVINGGTFPRYVETGHLVYARAGTLFAVRFDPAKGVVHGAPVPVLHNVATGVLNGEAHWTLAGDGTLLYASGGVIAEEKDLVWVDLQGEQTPGDTVRRNYGSVRVSPWSGRIAATLEGSTFDVWILDPERGSANRVSFGGDDADPVWSPDESRLAWSSSRGGLTQIFMRVVDGSMPEEQLTNLEERASPTSWSPDGSVLLFDRTSTAENQSDVWLLPLGSEPRALIQTPFHEFGARFSPDGRWVAYGSNESGEFEIYVTPYPGPGPRWKVSTGGGDLPVWSGSGDRIFYRWGRRYFAVDFRSGPPVSFSTPRLLFESADYERSFDASADGERLLMVRTDRDHRTTSTLNLIANWTDELKRRVP
jgi:eukaryotic-like serine/threonine-protein kinase